MDKYSQARYSVIKSLVLSQTLTAAPLKFCNRVNNFIPHITIGVITYPYWELS